MSARLQVGSVDPPGERLLSWKELGVADRDLLVSADYVVIRPDAVEVRPVLTRIHALNAEIQLIVVPGGENRSDVERALLFTPGVGEVWIVAEEELGTPLFSKAAEVTRARRSYAGTQARVRDGLARLAATSQERREISDAFLAALLGVVPHPVLSLDEEGRIISANTAAARILDRVPEKLEGESLIRVLRPSDPAPLEGLLERGTRGPASGEITFPRADGSVGCAETHVAPVHAGSHRVRCVVLHDVTESRRIHRELKQHATVLKEEAAQREHANRELARRTRELERALTARSRFYWGMSHELRTPLNAIIGYLELLLDGVQGEISNEAADSLRRAERAAIHLLDVVSDVLDLAKIEAGKIELVPDSIRFPDVLHELVDTIHPPGALGVKLDVAGPAEGMAIETDPRRVRQILLNLLSNAIKFGEGKPVRAEWSPRPDGGISVDVIDQGPGIPPERQSQIFEEFVQFARLDDEAGTGLGLTISSRLAAAIGARIEVESELGRGTRFRLVLPPGLDHAPETPT